MHQPAFNLERSPAPETTSSYTSVTSEAPVTPVRSTTSQPFSVESHTVTSDTSQATARRVSSEPLTSVTEDTPPSPVKIPSVDGKFQLYWIIRLVDCHIA